MSEESRTLVEEIRARLGRTVRRIALAELAMGLVVTAGLLAAYLLLSSSLEARFWFDAPVRTVLFWSFVGVAVVALTLAVARPMLRLRGLLPGLSEEETARRIGGHFPGVSDRLINLLHLAKGRSSAAPAPLVDRAVTSLGQDLREVPFESVESFEGVRRRGRWALLPLAGLLLFFVLAPATFLSALERVFSPRATFARPAPYALTITPGDIELVRGGEVAVEVRAVGASIPDDIVLEFVQEGEDRVEGIRLAPDSTGRYRHTVSNVRRSFRYRIAADPVVSAWFDATVTERPIVRGLQLRLTYPAYTRIPPRLVEPNVGDVTALAGTRVDVEVQTGGRGVALAELVFGDSARVEMTLDGQAATGAFTVRQTGTYQIRLLNTTGVANQDPITHTIQVQEDAYPAITLLEPRSDLDLSEDLAAPVRARIVDDFGFSRLTLHYRLAESAFGDVSETFTAIPLDGVDPNLLDQEIQHLWRLAGTGLDLVPGDEVAFYLQVRDNDAVAGYKAAQTPVFTLRFPSLAEQYDQLNRDQETAESGLEDLMRESEEVREAYEELRDELRRKQNADWEDERQVERLSEQVNSFEQRLDQIEQLVEEFSDEMQSSGLVSEETSKAYEELQRVIEEIDSPELREALEQLQQAMQNLDLERMQQGFEQFEFNQEQYQQRLERALELFKRLRTEQQLDEAQRRAAELAEREEQLARETERLQRQAASETPEESSEEEAGQETNEADEGEQGAEQQDAEQSDAEQQDAGQSDAEQSDAEQSDAEQSDAEQSDAEQSDAEQQDAEQSDAEQQDAEQSAQARQRTPEQLAEEQRRAAEAMEQLEELIDQIESQMEELSNTPTEQMNEVQEQLERQALPEQMQQNSQQLQQQQLDNAQQGQQQMQQQLQQLQQQLSQMQQQMGAQQMQINLAGLRRALDDVLTLSLEQESMRGQVSRLTPDNPALRQFAQQQTELSEGLSVVSDTLQKLAANIPQMSREVQQETGEALRSMERANTQMAERQVATATGMQKESMTHLNNLALLLSDLMDQLMNQSGAGSGSMSMQQMLQQLQQMSGQQQQINQQIQQMLNDMMGNRLSSDQQRRLEQLARQQQALREQLQELSNNPDLAGQVLGDLERIAEQMEETIRELSQRPPTRETVVRQREILTRLLDAQRSLQERGQTQEREGRQGEDLVPRPPDALPPDEQAEQLRRDLIRALESGYTPDFEDLIKRYFEVLQQQSSGPPGEE